MISEWSGKGAKGNGRALIWCSIPAFARRDWVKPGRIVGVPAEIRIVYILNVSERLRVDKGCTGLKINTCQRVNWMLQDHVLTPDKLFSRLINLS
jgi:hypothetical protein